jgi:predicted permease
MRRGATPALAANELTTYFDGPRVNDWQRQARGAAQPLEDVILGDTRSAVLLVALAAALLLFLTVLNVANLLLVRALGRVKELVVRSSLGASRGRIGAQLLAESGLLAVAGGVTGVAVAVASVELFLTLVPAGFPRVEEVGVNVASLVAALSLTTLATVASGLAPFLFATRVRARDVLRSGSHHTGRRTRTVGEALVIGQIGFAAATLCAAGLVTRSLIELQTLDLAFDRGNLLVATLVMPEGALSGSERRRAVLDEVVAGVGALREVIEVTPVWAVPFVGAGGGIDARVSTPELTAADPDGSPVVNMEIVAPNYFAMLRMPVLRGRPFGDEDRTGSVPVAVVSSSLARRLWPDRDPIGQRLVMGSFEATVVGEVPDTRYRDVRTARPTLYLPLGQAPVIPSTLLVRTVESTSAIIPVLRGVVAAVHPDLTLVDASSLDTMLEAPRAQPRLNAAVLALFAGTALLLAGMGLFSTIATMVRQRTREIGIRMTLGATPRNVRARVLLRGVFLATVGGALGIAGALAASRLFSALLFEVSPTDPLTLIVVGVTLLGVAAVASSAPAWAGSRISPAVALSSD